jgi:hypothetical protein
MLKFLTSHDSILVEVHDGRYDCYGDPTPRSAHLTKVLQTMGGIADTVPDGYYHFNAIRRGFVTTYTLTPYED